MPSASVSRARLNEISGLIVQAAFNVHEAVGPGLLEGVYMACLKRELAYLGLTFREQVPVPIVYRDLKLPAGLRLDLLVEECVVVEVKAVHGTHPVFTAQLLSYLRLTGHKLGLLINFHVPLIKEGIKRVIL